MVAEGNRRILKKVMICGHVSHVLLDSLKKLQFTFMNGQMGKTSEYVVNALETIVGLSEIGDLHTFDQTK